MHALPLRLVALVAALLCLPNAVRGDLKAEAALKPLSERFNDGTGDKAALAKDLLAFQRAHAGTPQAVEAAVMLAKLPSLLDQMDATKIKPIERFDWQPKELVGLLGEHLGRHGQSVTCVCFSPDGKTAASGGAHFVRLWDPVTMRLKHLIDVPYVTSISFNQAGTLLAAGHGNGVVNVWDVTPLTGPVLKFGITATTTSVPSIAFSPDDSIAVACSDNQFRVWNVGGKELKELSTVNGHDKGVTSVAWSHNGKILVTSGGDAILKFWTLGEGGLSETSKIAGLPSAASAMIFNHAGTNLAAAFTDGSVRLWTLPAAANAKERLALGYPKSGAVYGLSFSISGQTLAVSYGDSTARLWTVGGAKAVERAKLEGHAGPVTSIAYAPDNKTLITGSSDWTVRSWDLTGPKPVQRHEPWSHLSHVYTVAFAPDNLTMATGSLDSVLRLWDMARPEPRTRNFLKGDSIPIYSVAFSPDGKFVAAGGNGTQVRQWDAATGRLLRPCPSPSGAVNHVAYSPDGKRLFFSTTTNLLVYDSEKAVEKMRITGHDSNIHQGAFSPDGKYGLTGSGKVLTKDGKVVIDKDMRTVYVDCFFKLWDLESGRELYCDKTPAFPISSVAFSADSKQAFSGMNEPRVRRWNVGEEGKLTEGEAIKGASGYLYSMTVSPDNKTTLTRGLDGSLVLRDLATGAPLKQWIFWENIGNVAYAPDGRHIAVGLGTGVVYILRLELK